MAILEERLGRADLEDALTAPIEPESKELVLLR